jgi:hypothetical protein
MVLAVSITELVNLPAPLEQSRMIGNLGILSLMILNVMVEVCVIIPVLKVVLLSQFVNEAVTIMEAVANNLLNIFNKQKIPHQRRDFY